MEDEKIRRGIDLKNRLWEGRLVNSFQKTFSLGNSQRFRRVTFIFILAVFLINIFLVFPIFQRDLSLAMSSTALQYLASVAQIFNFLTKDQFFSILVVFALSFAPISFYFFVRGNVLSNPLVALLATLLYILPNPFFKDGLPLADGILAGDGAHAIAFAFIPFILLFVQDFISTGSWGFAVISTLSLSFIAILSPFAFFNLLIILLVLVLSDSFLGDLRIKFLRLILLILLTFGLSFFWYYPNIIHQITLLGHVKYAYAKFLSILPLLVPVIPILGLLSFLIFDRKEKLQPIFIALSLFLIYLFLYFISETLKFSGIFTASRYYIELSFAGALFLALLLTPLFNYLSHINSPSKLLSFVYSLILAVLLGAVAYFYYNIIVMAQQSLATKNILSNHNIGIGNLQNSHFLISSGFTLANIVSILTLAFLLIMLFKSVLFGKEK